jgi:hypothetical protein
MLTKTQKNSISGKELNFEFYKKEWNGPLINTYLKKRFLTLFNKELSVLLLELKLNDLENEKKIHQILIKSNCNKDDILFLQEEALDLKSWCRIIITRENKGCKNCPEVTQYARSLVNRLDNFVSYLELIDVML